MNIKNIFMAGGLLLLGAVALTSCSGDEEYDVDGIDYERLYMQDPNTTKQSTILKTPVGYMGAVSGKIAIQTTAPAASNITATVAIDNSQSAVDNYNSINETNYKPIPAGVASLSSSQLSISSGKVSSDSIELVINESAYSQLVNGTDYLIPVTITDYSAGSVHLARDAQFRSRYFVLTYKETESLLLTEGTASDLQGSASGEGSSWTCIDAVNLDKDGYGGLYSGGWYGRWDFLDSNANKTYFTVDLGSEHNVGGFLVESYTSKYFSFEISIDGNSWTDIGDTQEAAKIRDDNWNTWYGLYAALPARYVKVNIVLDPESFYWQYADWGYAGLLNFDLLFND